MIYLVNDTLKRKNFNHATIEDVVDYCKDKTILSVDTETTGLDYTNDYVTLFQIGDKETQFLIDTREESPEGYYSMSHLKDILQSKEIVKIFHNAKFDYKFIKKWSDITCQGVYDTFLVELVNSCGKSLGYSLKDLCKRYFTWKVA
jgi:ribonuclease D